MANEEQSDSSESDMRARMADALADGRKIDAVRIYCESTGGGVSEAKKFLDELMPRLAEQDPERFGHLTKNSGCGASAAVFLLCLLAAAWFFTRSSVG